MLCSCGCSLQGQQRAVCSEVCFGRSVPFTSLLYPGDALETVCGRSSIQHLIILQKEKKKRLHLLAFIYQLLKKIIRKKSDRKIPLLIMQWNSRFSRFQVFKNRFRTNIFESFAKNKIVCYREMCEFQQFQTVVSLQKT